MATSSLTKEFMITDPKAFERFIKDVDAHAVKNRDISTSKTLEETKAAIKRLSYR